MSSDQTSRSLDRRRRALVAYGFGWVVISRAALAAPGASLPQRQRWLDRLAARLPAPPSCTRAEAASTISAAARRVPGTRCLGWALALRGLLAQGGVASDLRIGVAAAGRGRIRAHAWIDSGGETWSWGESDEYSELRPAAPTR